MSSRSRVWYKRAAPGAARVHLCCLYKGSIMLSSALLICAIAAATQGAYVFEQSADTRIDLEDLFPTMVQLMQEEASLLHVLENVTCCGDKCSICEPVSILGEFCLDISTPNDTVTLEARKHFIKLMSVEFVNKLPKFCALNHLCIQITDLEIKNGEVCLSVEYNSKAIIKDACFKL